MDELSFRIRTATPEETAVLPRVIESLLSHPEGKGRRTGYRAAAQRGELLVLERYDTRLRDWRISAMVDWHMRVDDVLTIRDIGTEGQLPHSGMVKQLLMELLSSLAPVETVLKVRGDAGDWNAIIASIPGFALEGTEYRRPHWINVWTWTRNRAVQAAPRTARPPGRRR